MCVVGWKSKPTKTPPKTSYSLPSGTYVHTASPQSLQLNLPRWRWPFLPYASLLVAYNSLHAIDNGSKRRNEAEIEYGTQSTTTIEGVADDAKATRLHLLGSLLPCVASDTP